MPETFSFHVLPGCCLLCGGRSAEFHDLCRECRRDLVRHRSACRGCALPVPAGAALCGECIRKPPPHDIALAAFQYRFPLDRLIQRFKFHADHAAGRLLSELLAQELVVGDTLPCCLVPVPLHASRLRERGFNQSELLFRPLADRLRVPLATDLLERCRETAVQSGMDAVARRRNVRGAFAATGKSLPAHVAVVDDVMTTGSTLGEISGVLKRAGVEKVEVWALARTVSA